MLSARTIRRLKRVRKWRFPRITPYEAYRVGADGSWEPLETHGIIIVLRRGVELELDLAPHPGHAGGLPISTFDGILAIRPGAANVAHLSVEAWARQSHRKATKRRHR